MSREQPLVLGLEHVTAGYRHGDKTISDVSIELHRGEICAVLGPNGAGKSTLLRAIIGLLPYVRGDIIASATTLNGKRADQIARLGIAYVPEGRGILNSLTVRENLLLGAHRGARVQQTSIDDVLDRVTSRFPILRQRVNQAAGLLSGGEQQMLAIARAMAWAPSILLIDEPTLGLAPKYRVDLSLELARIAAEDGISVLLAEQDVKFAARCARRAYVLRLGKVAHLVEDDIVASFEELSTSYLGRNRPPSDPQADGRQ